MGRIRVLDDQMVNRIAAGEVVERPASVVKELVENSLDAGATFIRVDLASGGKRLIRVADDGEGMDRNDALLALERHATSKVTSGANLLAIATLGFRGEALPSIAAISHFRLRTAPEGAVGTELEVHGGKIKAVREISADRGTTVEVSGLFRNLPARRKFLRSESTELSHSVRLVGRYALAHPEVRFRLDHGGRRLLEAPPAQELGERIRQVYSADFHRRLLPFSMERAGISVRGYAGRPVDASSRRDIQHLFVNGRPVQDRTLLHAVQEAYGNTMPRGQRTAIFLFLDLEPTLVDVNVHPQKTEVRFHRPGPVHDLARDGVASALNQEAAVPSLGDLRRGPAQQVPSSVSASALRYLEVREKDAALSSVPRAGRQAPSAGSEAPRPAPSFLPGSGGKAEGEGRRELVALGQYHDSYIVAEDRRDLVLVDQHAAHERVLFERYLSDAERNQVEVQKLLFPMTVELAPHEQVLLEDEAEEFKRLGFLVEPFGPGTVRLDGVPAVAEGLEPSRLLRELLGVARDVRSASSGIENLRRKLVTSAACQAAIKVNHALTKEGMQRLLDDLFLATNPTTCPHGRPVVFRLTLGEVERAFRRR